MGYAFFSGTNLQSFNQSENFCSADDNKMDGGAEQ